MTVVYELPVDGTLILGIMFNLIYLTMSMFFIYIVVKKIGHLHVLAEIRAGSEQVLNDLDQGVVIL